MSHGRLLNLFPDGGEPDPSAIAPDVARPVRKHAVPDWPATARILAESIANGTHSECGQYVCTQCREWVDAIYFSFLKVRLCGACADLIGQGPDADAKNAGGRS